MEARAPLLGATLALVLLTAGCVQFTASEIPENLLHGATGNGWIFDRDDPPDGPRTESFGLVQARTKVYKDPGDTGDAGNGGYPASLSLVSFEVAFDEPDREEITDRARDLVQEEAERLGVELERPPQEGERTVKSGDRAQYFLYDGQVDDDSSLFTRQADVKVAGVVWNCKEGGGNTVVAVALAQVNERTQGVIEDPDDTNWRELWRDARPGGDPDGGLIVHATCG